MAKRLRLSQKKFSLVDNSVFKWAKEYKWSAMKSGNTFYAMRTFINGKKRSIFLHHCIVGRPLVGIVDHINGNGLDNRRSNLRFASNSENLRNSYKHRNGHKLGTHIRRRGDRWQAILIGKNWKSLGMFSTKKEAIGVL